MKIEEAMEPNSFDAVFYVAAMEELSDEDTAGLKVYAVVRDWSLTAWMIEAHGNTVQRLLIGKDSVEAKQSPPGWLANLAQSMLQ